MSGFDDLYGPCTRDCERVVECRRCRRSKLPIGRTGPGPSETSPAWCDEDCPGYREEPRPGHLFPGEFDRLREAQRNT